MKRFLAFWVLNTMLVGGQIGLAKNDEFKLEQLSTKGRIAYSKLEAACVFRIGPVGYGAQTSKEELALYDLLEEDHALAALKSLVKTGSYEAGLYGLVGLSIRDHGEFNRAVEVYKARKVRPESQETSSALCLLATDETTVATQSGCIIDVEPREKVVTAIQSGRFDRRLDAKYRPSN